MPPTLPLSAVAVPPEATSRVRDLAAREGWRLELLDAVLALAAADDLADARQQHVHRGHRLAVVVQAHVERLDLLRVVHQDHRLARVLLREVALVLATGAVSSRRYGP